MVTVNSGPFIYICKFTMRSPTCIVVFISGVVTKCVLAKDKQDSIGIRSCLTSDLNRLSGQTYQPPLCQFEGSLDGPQYWMQAQLLTHLWEWQGQGPCNSRNARILYFNTNYSFCRCVFFIRHKCFTGYTCKLPRSARGIYGKMHLLIEAERRIYASVN